MKFGKEKLKLRKNKFFKLPDSSGSEKYHSKINKVVNVLKKKNLIFYLLLLVKIMLGY